MKQVIVLMVKTLVKSAVAIGAFLEVITALQLIDR